MGKICLSRAIPTLAVFLLLLGPRSRCEADTTLYNDGAWIVNGVDEADTNLNRFAVTVGGVPAGSFTELTIFRSFAGGFSEVYSIQASGGLRPQLSPSGDPGGTFYLTGYWDCYAGERLGMLITSLNIQPNTKNTNFLKFNGSISNGTSLQATDLRMKLNLLNNSTVRLDVRYTLYATTSICVDPWKQQSGEGFPVARIESTYLSDQVMDNDGMRVKGFLGPICDCCDCWYNKGYICATFTNATGYVLPYYARMSNSQLLMLHALPGPLNTPALSITLKTPSRGNCGAQGYTVLSTDPTENNVSVWANWQKAKSQYAPGQKVQSFHFILEALLPGAPSCDLIVPPPSS